VTAVETQSVAVTQTTSTIEQLAATATSIAETAKRVSTAAGGSRADAEAGFVAVDASKQAIQRLLDRTRLLATRADALREQIDKVSATTKVMDELSRRTTMLALSAAIEAASAGPQAAGFTNVAREVKALAERAREATGRIDAIVEDLRVEVEATAAALHRIGEMVDRTAIAAHGITAATGQQRAAADDVVRAMASVTKASAEARLATTRHSESAERLRALARDADDAIATFRLPATNPAVTRTLS